MPSKGIAPERLTHLFRKHSGVHLGRARGQDRREAGLGAATVVKAANSIATRKS